MALISLAPALALTYFYISTFRSLCAVPNMAVFCISLTSCFLGMVLTYFLNNFEMVQVAPIITGITLVLLLLLLLLLLYGTTTQGDLHLTRKTPLGLLLVRSVFYTSRFYFCIFYYLFVQSSISFDV
jgi:hypothetical protein